jgi:hypothetical protein
MQNDIPRRNPATNSRFAIGGVLCFYKNEELNSRLVHLMKFINKNPRLFQATKRYRSV